MIKVIIADDHAVVRKGINQILDDVQDINITGEASNGNELISKIIREDYDVVILDISMPGRDGLDVLKEIKSIKPKLPVLIFTIYPEDQFALRILKAGASGYINKEEEPEIIIEAIRRLNEGRRFISDDVAEMLASKLGKRQDKLIHETLSDREFQVMSLIASGLTVSQIARKLSLSTNTVSTYRNRILEKMRMKTNAEVTHYAIKNNLV